MTDSSNTSPVDEQVTLTYRRQTFTVRSGIGLREAIMQCDLNPETVLAVIAGELVTDDVVLKKGDQVKLIATISGG